MIIRFYNFIFYLFLQVSRSDIKNNGTVTQMMSRFDVKNIVILNIGNIKAKYYE